MTRGFDFAVFGLYLACNILLGLWVARKKTTDARGYFLAGDRLPWYTVGGSIIAANISTEHFIGMTGIAYAVGFVVAQWEWGNWFTFSALIWVFLPYYIRGGLYTMPEFLERRYNVTCRTLFAVCSLVLWIIAQMAVVMLAGGKALKGMFGINETVTILALALLAGSYTIYGGLISVAWTDFLQFVVMMLGGVVVTVIGLDRVGGLGPLLHSAPEKFKMIYPITDKEFPWFGVWTILLSIGIWYNCTNQFIVQRCLGARSEWDARMGVVFAGFMKILLPLLVVIPGIVAFRLFPGLTDKDQAFPTLVRELVPAGLSGVVMAGLASGMLSHISSVLNSCSTVFTMDLYKPALESRWFRSDRLASHEPGNVPLTRPAGTLSPTGGEGRGEGAQRVPAKNLEAHLVLVGRVSGVVILVIATLLAIWFTRRQLGVFLLLQDIGAWVAAPISAVFLLGVLWRRATAAAATCVLLLGFPYTALLQYVLFKKVPWLMPFDNWLNRTFLVWATSMILMVVVSGFTKPPDPDTVKGIIWTWKVAALPEAERARNRGLRNLLLWWSVFIGLMAALYAYVIWFQFWGPGKSG